MIKIITSSELIVDDYLNIVFYSENGSKTLIQFDKNNFSDTYWIHRTRRNFPDHTPNIEGEDTFELMSKRGVNIIDRIVVEEIKGKVDHAQGIWYIPQHEY